MSSSKMEIQLNTLEKYREASFFLDELKQSTEEFPKFNYILNAFITSARSILWVMRNEFSVLIGWEQWYESRSPNNDEKFFLKQISDLRNKSQKREPLRTGALVTFNIHKDDITDDLLQLLEENQGKEIIIQEASRDSEHAFKFHLDEIIPTLDEFQGRSAVEVCENYLLLIKGIIRECHDKFMLPLLILKFCNANPQFCKAITGDDKISNYSPTYLKSLYGKLKSRVGYS
jgi:hypothetical protein